MPAADLVSLLAQRTLELVDIPSESRHETAVTAYVQEAMPLELLFSDGESLLYAKRTGRPLVLLAGHTDTVPAQGNLPGRFEDGAIVGLGASDMKGGLGVMIELARWADGVELGYDLALLFFPREELGPNENPLPGVFDRAPIIDEAALVICLEPTDNTLQLGCLGNLVARVVFEGRSAHSARPWLGENAIKATLEGLRSVFDAEPRDVEIDGLVFREVISATQISGGIAANVIPARVEVILNFRYAPDRSPRRRRGTRPRAGRAGGRDPLPLDARPRRARLAGCREAAHRGRLRGATKAGVDERRGLRRPRPRRGEPWPRWDTLRPRGRRTGRDRRARADVRRAAAVPPRYGLSMALELSPVLAELAQYPFARLDDWKADATERGIELIDFGMGDPREVTPPFIREALLASVDAVSSYPRAPGLPELRTAIAAWVERRFGVQVDPDSELVPTLGSKEAIFSFAQLALGEKRVVAIPGACLPRVRAWRACSQAGRS